VVRGVLLNSSPLNSALTSIKLRFCIGDRQMFIFDESRSNIVKGDTTSLKPDTRYRFAVYFHGPGDNYEVIVSNVKVCKIRAGIDQF